MILNIWLLFKFIKKLSLLKKISCYHKIPGERYRPSGPLVLFKFQVSAPLVMIGMMQVFTKVQSQLGSIPFKFLALLTKGQTELIWYWVWSRVRRPATFSSNDFFSKMAGPNRPKFLWEVLGVVLYQVCSNGWPWPTFKVIVTQNVKNRHFLQTTSSPKCLGQTGPNFYGRYLGWSSIKFVQMVDFDLFSKSLWLKMW